MASNFNKDLLDFCDDSVLVVDDYRDCADVLVEVLRFAGISAHACYSTEAALVLAASLKPRVVVMEPTMPGEELDGYRLAGLLRQDRSPQDPLLLVAYTSAGQPQHQARMARAGFNAFLLKPSPAPEILALVQDCLTPSWTARPEAGQLGVARLH